MRRFVIAALAPLVLSAGGCSGWWPWGGGSGEVPRVPPGATAYKCDAGKELFVRFIDGGKSAMVILPEREFRLDRIAEGGSRYSNERTTLTVDGGTAMLQDGSTVTHSNCKPA